MSARPEAARKPRTRKKKPAERRMSRLVQARLTPAEYRAFARRAREMGMRDASLVRHLIVCGLARCGALGEGGE